MGYEQKINLLDYYISDSLKEYADFITGLEKKQGSVSSYVWKELARTRNQAIKAFGSLSSADISSFLTDAKSILDDEGLVISEEYYEKLFGIVEDVELKSKNKKSALGIISLDPGNENLALLTEAALKNAQEKSEEFALTMTLLDTDPAKAQFFASKTEDAARTKISKTGNENLRACALTSEETGKAFVLDASDEAHDLVLNTIKNEMCLRSAHFYTPETIREYAAALNDSTVIMQLDGAAEAECVYLASINEGIPICIHKESGTGKKEKYIAETCTSFQNVLEKIKLRAVSRTSGYSSQDGTNKLYESRYKEREKVLRFITDTETKETDTAYVFDADDPAHFLIIKQDSITEVRENAGKV